MVKSYALISYIMQRLSVLHFSIFFSLLGVGLVAFFIILPIFNLTNLVFYSNDFDSLFNVFNSYYLKLFLVTFYQAFLSTVASLFIGLPAAFILYQINFSGRRVLLTFCTIPFILPVVVVALSFRDLFSNTGLISQLLGFSSMQFNQSIWIIIIAHAYYNMSIIIRIVGPYWEKISMQFEEASNLLGAKDLQKMFYVYLPLLMPVIFAASMLVFLFCFTSFGLILILGTSGFDTLELVIYRLTNGLYGLQEAVILSLLQIIFCTIIFIIYSKAIQSSRLDFVSHISVNKNFRELKVFKKIAALVFLCFISIFSIMPIAILFVRAFTFPGIQNFSMQNFIQIFTNTGNLSYIYPLDAILNSLTLALGTSFVVMLIGFFAAFFIESQKRFLKRIFDILFLLPIIVPVITLSLGIIITFNHSFFDLRHSVILIFIVHILLGLPFAYYLSLLAIASVSRQIKEASLLLGCAKKILWYKIYLPLVRNYLLTGIIFSFAISLGEFGSVSMLRGSNFYTIPLVIYQYLNRPGAYFLGSGYALSVILVVISFITFYSIERLNINIFKK